MSRGPIGRVIWVCILTIALGSVASARPRPRKPPKPAPGAPGPADAGKPKQVADLAAFLVKPAEQALAKRNYKAAVSIYRGIVAVRGDGDEAVWKLAEAWTLAGQFRDAADELERYRDAVADPGQRQKAQAEIDSLLARPTGFTAGVFQPTPARKEATEAFKRGRKAFAAKRYEEAILLFRAGYAMAPDLPGNLRELGESYEKLGRSAEANDFYTRYLMKRPFGKNADRIRERLVKAGLVGKLSVETAVPCDIWMDGQIVPGKPPLKGIVVAPGRHTLLCHSAKYAFAWYEKVTVPKAGEGKVVFNWAILENKLDPWGRVVLENPLVTGQMNDIGLFEEVGVPVPADRRALKVVLRSGDSTRQKEMLLRLEPGQRVKLEW